MSGISAMADALEEIASMSFWQAGPAVDIARRALAASPSARRTVYEWCDRHHAAEFADGLCAVKALGPFGAVHSACEFDGDVWVVRSTPQDGPCAQ